MMVPPIVSQVAQQTAVDQRGVGTALYTRTFQVHAGVSARQDRLVFTGIYVNGDLKTIYVLTDTLGSVNATPEQIDQVKTQYERPKPADVFHAPWDARYLRDYKYTMVNPTTIGFSSLVTDTAHGSGTFTIDGGKHVTGYQYTMSANWPHATNGTVSGQRAEVLPRYWAVTHEVQQYTGTYGPFKAAAITEIVQSSFRRFANVAAAQRAVHTR